MRVAIPMSSVLLLTSLATAQIREVRVAPRDVDWATATKEGFDPSRAMPWATGGPESSVHAAMRELVALRFESVDGDEDEVYARSFGDLVAACARLRDRPRAQAMLLDRLKRSRPDIWKQVGKWLPGLVKDQYLRSSDWDPAVERDDDGFVFGEPIRIGGPQLPNWREVEGSHLVQQAATLIYADLAAMETVENDYRPYYDHVGATYETLTPVPGSLLRGKGPDDRPFSMLRIRFKSDLPFPFSSYSCDLQLLKRIDADGFLEGWTEDRSPDFYWLSGCAIYLPVFDSEQNFVALLTVRQFGFDMRGVPDGDADRRTSLRGLLGNLKRRAEALWAARSEDTKPVTRDVIPEVPVIGRP